LPSLFLTCRHCRSEFPSGIAVTAMTETTETVAMFGLRHRCPRCGTDAAYYTPDYHLPAATDWNAQNLAKAEEPRPGTRRSDLMARAPFGWLAGDRIVN